ncbi:hypothetical protein SDC9_171007 [bioreactor metagenome]|uniref:Uncharacterized protein n=1 Tax=bioreactor metagenome TaxID=1076179 RepID=A0A645GIB7_9ZZZZ
MRLFDRDLVVVREGVDHFQFRPGADVAGLAVQLHHQIRSRVNALAGGCQNRLLDGFHQLLLADSAFLLDILKSCQKFVIHQFCLRAFFKLLSTPPKKEGGPPCTRLFFPAVRRGAGNYSHIPYFTALCANRQALFRLNRKKVSGKGRSERNIQNFSSKDSRRERKFIFFLQRVGLIFILCVI